MDGKLQSFRESGAKNSERMHVARPRAQSRSRHRVVSRQLPPMAAAPVAGAQGAATQRMLEAQAAVACAAKQGQLMQHKVKPMVQQRAQLREGPHVIYTGGGGGATRC